MFALYIIYYYNCLQFKAFQEIQVLLHMLHPRTPKSFLDLLLLNIKK